MHTVMPMVNPNKLIKEKTLLFFQVSKCSDKIISKHGYFLFMISDAGCRILWRISHTNPPRLEVRLMKMLHSTIEQYNH